MDNKRKKRSKGMGLCGGLVTLFIIYGCYFLVVAVGVFSNLDYINNLYCSFWFNTR